MPSSITAPELHQRLISHEAIQVVDVREPMELELAKLPHPVIHLPLSTAQEWIPTLAEQLDQERPVAVVCHAGVRSWQFACWLMQEQGYEAVSNLVGGIDAWSVQVDPSVPRY